MRQDTSNIWLFKIIRYSKHDGMAPHARIWIKLSFIILCSIVFFPANAETTECDKLLLGKLSRNQIIIVGEIHIDPMHKKQKGWLVKGALRGEFFLGVEGVSIEESETLIAQQEKKYQTKRSQKTVILGLENNIVHAFTGILKAYEILQ
ncbi:MAG: hypothetical protein HY843_09055, partial [Bdellovibrio sp.]|nr:hypothetical protein [Bdellovibrio sp.]